MRKRSPASMRRERPRRNNVVRAALHRRNVTHLSRPWRRPECQGATCAAAAISAEGSFRRAGAPLEECSATERACGRVRNATAIYQRCARRSQRGGPPLRRSSTAHGMAAWLLAGASTRAHAPVVQRIVGLPGATLLGVHRDQRDGRARRHARSNQRGAGGAALKMRDSRARSASVPSAARTACRLHDVALHGPRDAR